MTTDREIIHAYTKERKSAREIAEEFGCSQDRVYNILRDHNIPRDIPGGSAPTAPDKKKAIIAAYLAGEGATSVAKRFGVDKKTVYNLLVRSGHGTRPTSDRTGTTYSVPAGVLAGVTSTGRPRGKQRGDTKSRESNAFSELTDEAAYWIGYLMADGCISKNPHRPSRRLFLMQGRKHITHLEKLRSYIGCTNVITTGTHADPAGSIQEHCCLAVTSDSICDRLGAYGVTEGKPERSIKDARLLEHPHFWRGCVDGDGNISEDRSRVYLSGHLPLLAQWETYVRRVTGTAVHKEERPGCWVYSLTSVPSRALVAHIYLKNEGVCLPEKMRLARKMAG